ncbi:GspH/FimT family pseudopilin [Ferrigenium sp. UT5]|uniref:GspH/FimT family pseudopilin n=1 Tax=Ferrigenium sp. UT5 TaxID=3242105 RepID=UPI00354F8FF6
MKPDATCKVQRGVTLAELLIVIAIAAILAALAGPSFTDFINRTRLNSQVSQLVSDLNRARSESIKRNTAVLLCVRADDATCGNTTDWQNGWLVCVDVGSTACTTPVAVHAPLPATLTLTGPANGIQFRPNGSSGLGAATLTAGGTGLDNKIIQVSVTGNISRP